MHYRRLLGTPAQATFLNEYTKSSSPIKSACENFRTKGLNGSVTSAKFFA